MHGGDTHSIAIILITFGSLFLVGLAADLLGRQTPLPRVTLLLFAGFLIGPSMLDWLPDFAGQWFPILTNVALAMIGFLLGGRLSREHLAQLGGTVMAMSLSILTVTIALVAGVLMLLGAPVEVALMLAGIAPATAPASTSDVVRESRAAGPFTDTLLGVVAIDDAWGLLAFVILMALADGLTGNSGAAAIVASGFAEVGGAVLLGVVIGIPAAYLTGRIRSGEPTQAEALGIVLLAAGLALHLHVSYLLTVMTVGAMVANLAKHHQRPFHAIEGIDWPFMILFFLLAGASLNLGALVQVGVLGVVYIVLRVTGRILGTRIGAIFCPAPPPMRRWLGWALLAQAGVPLGMALVAGQRYPQHAEAIVTIVLGSTILFEMFGPLLTRQALKRTGEAGAIARQ